jgi:hypothetical protein
MTVFVASSLGFALHWVGFYWQLGHEEGPEIRDNSGGECHGLRGLWVSNNQYYGNS